MGWRCHKMLVHGACAANVTSVARRFIQRRCRRNHRWRWHTVLARALNTDCASAMYTSTGAGAAIMYSATGADVAYTIGVDAGAMYTSSGAGAGMKYPFTGAGAQKTADAGAMYSSIGAAAEITADADAVYLSTDVAPRSRLVLARCARPLA